MNKLKIVLGFLVIAGVVAFLIFRGHVQVRVHENDEALLRQSERIAQLVSENERLSNLVVSANSTSTVSASSEPSRELLRLRAEVGLLRQQTNDLRALRQNNDTLSQAVAESQTNQLPAEDLYIVQQTHAVDATSALLQAIKKFATNHNGAYPGSLDNLIASGDFAATNLAGNLKFSDFIFGDAAGVDTRGKPVILRLKEPLAKPGGGAVMVVGGLDDAGVPTTSTWNVGP